MVEKGARRALDVLDEPFPILVPELAVPSTDDLALEAYWRRRSLVAGHAGQSMVITLRVSSNADDFGAI